MKPDPISMMLGYAAYHGMKKFKKPLRQMAVSATSQLFMLASSTKETAHRMKEEVEDIVAEAHYETMKESELAPQDMGNEENTSQNLPNTEYPQEVQGPGEEPEV